MRYCRLKMCAALGSLVFALLTGCTAPFADSAPLPEEYTAHLPQEMASVALDQAASIATGAPENITPEAVTARPAGDNQAESRREITILHTNDGRGMVDPCG